MMNLKIKKALLTTVASLLAIISNAQMTIDTNRIDTIGAYRLQRALLNATSLTGETEAIILHPNTIQQLCFDTRAVVKASTPLGGTVFMCMYFNSKDGYCGYYKPQLELNNAICDFNVNDPDFFITVTSLKGNVFIYSNLKDGNGLKHYVHTGATERNPYLFFNDSIASPPLMRKIGTRRYCNNKLVGVPYKIDGANTPTFFLHGRIQPVKVRYKKMLGHLGIGYLYGEDGLFFSLQMETERVNAKVLYIEKKDVCLDVSSFVWREGEEIRKLREELRSKIERYNRPMPNYSGNCVAEKIDLFNKEKLLVNKQSQNLNDVENGTINIRENNSNILMAIMAHEEGVEADIASLKLKLCNAQNIRENTESKAKKIRCITEHINRLIAYKAQMQQILANNTNDKTKAFGELLQAKTAMRASNECLMY